MWVRGNAVALRDEAGALTGHLGTVTDITAERTAADAVRESELRLRTLSDNLPDGAVYQATGDPGGGRRFVYISARVEQLFGVTPAEVMADAAALYGLVHADDLPRLAAAEEAAVRGTAAFDCEFRSHTPGGGSRSWWACPGCGRRAGDLFLVAGRDRLACRACCGLAYASQLTRKRGRTKPAGRRAIVETETLRWTAATGWVRTRTRSRS